MEKIDLTKCNNCRFRAKDEDGDISGRIRVSERGTVYLFVDGRGNKGFLADRMQKMGITDFEIVPRDPETYRDWQVGDVIYNLDDEGNTVSGEDEMCRVIFRSGELVAIAENYSAEEADINGCYTCSQLFREGWRLVLTDIEQQIIGEKKYEPQDGDICFVEASDGYCSIFIYKNGFHRANYYASLDTDKGCLTLLFTTGGHVVANSKITVLRLATEDEKQKLFDAMAKQGKRWNAEKKVVEDIPKPYEFKKGEPVLVRDYGDNIWKLAAFRQRSGNASYPYEITNAQGNCYSFRCCIPYNERTMHLLGTTEDYKEE